MFRHPRTGADAASGPSTNPSSPCMKWQTELSKPNCKTIKPPKTSTCVEPDTFSNPPFGFGRFPRCIMPPGLADALAPSLPDFPPLRNEWRGQSGGAKPRASTKHMVTKFRATLRVFTPKISTCEWSPLEPTPPSCLLCPTRLQGLEQRMALNLQLQNGDRQAPK